MTIRTNRRGFLHVGFAGGIGLTLADFLRLRAQADVKNTPSKEGQAKSVIFIYLPGGAPHQETFDPKPFAPVEYRGPMGSIATNVDGILLNEHLVQTAKVCDKIAFCRSMTHGEAAHERGTHNMFTGYKPSPALAFPSMGSVVTHEFPPKNNLPQYVCIPSMPNEFAGTGYLSSSFAPFSLGSDPADSGFTVQDLKLPGGVTDDRFSTPPADARCGQQLFRRKRKGRLAQGGRHVLSAGLLDGEFGQGPRGVQHRRRAGQAARRIRPQPGRCPHALGAAAG